MKNHTITSLDIISEHQLCVNKWYYIFSISSKSDSSRSSTLRMLWVKKWNTVTICQQAIYINLTLTKTHTISSRCKTLSRPIFGYPNEMGVLSVKRLTLATQWVAVSWMTHFYIVKRLTFSEKRLTFSNSVSHCLLSDSLLYHNQSKIGTWRLCWCITWLLSKSKSV